MKERELKQTQDQLRAKQQLVSDQPESERQDNHCPPANNIRLQEKDSRAGTAGHS